MLKTLLYLLLYLFTYVFLQCCSYFILLPVVFTRSVLFCVAQLFVLLMFWALWIMSHVTGQEVPYLRGVIIDSLSKAGPIFFNH